MIAYESDILFVRSPNNIENDRYIKVMQTIFYQQYSNYHIVFIDDASEDGTGEKMRQWGQDQ